jgi:hypothetical protein
MTGAGAEAGMVGVMAGAGGTDVVTYEGWPLYTYVADASPGMASGEGININGGPWYLMRPDGSPLVPRLSSCQSSKRKCCGHGAVDKANAPPASRADTEGGCGEAVGGVDE